MLTLVSDERQAVSFQLVESAAPYQSEASGIIEIHWAGMNGGAGYSEQCIAELWRDDSADNVKSDGRLSLHLGRWHSFAAADVSRLQTWIDSLLAGAPSDRFLTPSRLRPSGLAALRA